MRKTLAMIIVLVSLSAHADDAPDTTWSYGAPTCGPTTFTGSTPEAVGQAYSSALASCTPNYSESFAGCNAPNLDFKKRRLQDCGTGNRIKEISEGICAWQRKEENSYLSNLVFTIFTNCSSLAAKASFLPGIGMRLVLVRMQ